MRNNALKSVAAAVAYIEAHLGESLALGSVATAVHYSKYHLHRVFANATGLTIHEYAQRRRLTEAAKLLVSSDRSVLDIALAAGYESQQAFTSLFTAMYKQPPHRYRACGQFYPLQFKFEFDAAYALFGREATCEWEAVFASEADIPRWMALVRLVVDGFPHLQEDAYVLTLRQRIAARQALLLQDGDSAIGILLFSGDTGSIDFLGTHPLYRRRGVARACLDKVLCELADETEVSITTFRAGDRADTGRRKEILALGFAEAELLVEFGYPTQRFVLPREAAYD